jgi:hypothetical protein
MMQELGENGSAAFLAALRHARREVREAAVRPARDTAEPPAGGACAADTGGAPGDGRGGRGEDSPERSAETYDSSLSCISGGPSA